VIPVDLTVGALIYTFSAALLILSLWLHYDRRDRKLYEAERRKVIFHCIRCDKIYTGREGSEELACPRCQFQNVRLKF
jgi:DNA-directed RNA polymerase subunit RPC12/RpoP